ncbi:tyrosine-type recombinase/integrase [Clostridium sp. FP2]|uniref:site-specific integrase n=1 Tax=Clostridium sp. FP2 TaxID=2724481 RepID=UPI001CCB2D1C|nr:site-specific integrase [Clostridium sp. FP2]MBZ9623679.1 tyrosine-type recombinase/integrase [Clostridium sp. FP2]MBZ9623689.1 tyrosine-type recombinase/integrase [Clostridium sp. FP2]MBZ9624400.1 tyrosine-type recombinase/integrase [Clostridium sp. FP2]
MKQVTLDQTIQRALILMESLGIGKSNLTTFNNRHFSNIQKYFAEHGETLFNIDLLECYQKYQETRLRCKLIGNCYYTVLIRSVKILIEVYQTGTFQWRFYGSGPEFKVNSYFEKCIDKFLSTLYRSTETKRHINSKIRRFMSFLESRGQEDFLLLTSSDLTEYLSFIYPFNKGDMGHTVHALHVFVDFLVNSSIVTNKNLTAPLQKPVTARKSVSPCFTHDEVMLMMNQTDRKSPDGKRDYAIIYLASHTGLRAIDIANLKFKDIDWINDKINIIQKKTGGYLSLPLESDTGNAIADYILHGRPESKSEHIFLRSLSPYTKLGNNHSVGIIIVKYMRMANIDHKAYDGKSFHALRRSMATWMLESDIPLSTISQVLGHKSMNSAKPYLSMNERKLSECALGFEFIPIEMGIYS